MKLFFIFLPIALALSSIYEAQSRQDSKWPEINIQEETNKQQSVYRNEEEFEKIWASLHECSTNVFVANGVISSPYLQDRGYKPTGVNESSGYITIYVDEILYGFKVRKIILPTTWSIVALFVKAPVEDVKAELEKRYGILFDTVDGRYERRSANGKFQVFSSYEAPLESIVQCDSNQQ
ncbi:hypothetical protein [Methyloversatilis sp.]|uniref:hypothetical protein n=1 Tax=Methyloversatilis sp. TaxID=2569862 RepID=UPI003D2A3120